MIERILTQLPDLPVSHNPRISKRQLFANGEVPAITQIARATFPAGEVAPGHAHADMWEVFLFESGTGELEIDGSVRAVGAGHAFLVAPGEVHEIRNTGNGPLVVTVVGVRDPSGTPASD